jgi:hypothetical protein
MKGRRFMSKRVVIWLFTGTTAMSFLALIVLSFLVIRLHQEVSGQAAEPHPPDLSDCTRIEIQQGTAQQTPQSEGRASSLLTTEEAQYLASVRKLTVVESPEDIISLANEVALSKYESVAPEHERFREHLYLTVYCGSDRTASFFMFGDRLETEDGHVFINPRFSPCLDRIRSEVWPFQWRMYCALNLASLVRIIRNPSGAENEYPIATKWCDAVEQHERARQLARNRTTAILRCPAQREGRCHYAMNPNCKPDSLPDTVLLFETKAGWNQHGGPELFTFDNHAPKGGCVLLNDGTVKFIRTEQELKQLRWK